MAERRRSTTRSQKVKAVSRQSRHQWKECFCFTTTMMRSTFGAASNRGAECSPAATVTRASGQWRCNQSTRPVDSTPSPILVEVMNSTFIG